jgi:hypothetical protein
LLLVWEGIDLQLCFHRWERAQTRTELEPLQLQVASVGKKQSRRAATRGVQTNRHHAQGSSTPAAAGAGAGQRHQRWGWAQGQAQHEASAMVG